MIWVSTYWGREGRGDGSVHTGGGRGEVMGQYTLGEGGER